MIPEVYARLQAWNRYEQLRTSAFAAKITKYAIGSVIALATSVVVFAVLNWLGVGTTVDSVAAFVAGAVPNWVLNRKWAWQMEGQVEVAREVIGYVVVSVLSLIAASAATGATQHWVDDHVAKGDGLHVLLVTGAYVVVQALLFVVKFVIYDRWVFTGKSRVRAALRARADALRSRRQPIPARADRP